MITLILLIISFTIFVNTGNRTLTCNELFYKKLWINKTNNFSVCIPYDYYSFDAYWHSRFMDSMSDVYVNEDDKWWKYISDMSIGHLNEHWGLIVIKDCFWKSNKKDCFDYNKNNSEHVKIINSIKVLKEF